MGAPDLPGVMAEVSEINGYFHLFTGPGDGSWRPLTELFTDRAALEDRLSHIVGFLEIQEPRVAASLLQLGVASRLWGPAFGAAVLHGQVLEWTPELLRWQVVPSGPLPLRLPEPAVRTGVRTSVQTGVRTGVDPAESLYRDVTAMLDPFGELLRSVVKISPRLLWDNAASALAGAVRVLAARHPDRAHTAIDLGRRILDLGSPSAGHRLVEPVPGKPFFVREGCCLYYRIPGGGTCLDCALTPEETRRTLWEQASRTPS